jgi:tetratricopeptide (TPR) repeat protein
MRWILALSLALACALAMVAGASAAAAKRALERDPWRDARALADRGKPDSALALLRTELAREPRAFGLRWLEAGVTGETGRHAEAAALYQRLSGEFPDRAHELFADLARELGWAGRHDAAIAAWTRALAREPGSAEAELGLAQYENWSGRHRRAARRLEALTARDGAPGAGASAAEAWKTLAFARYWDDDPEGAQAALARHRVLAPDDAEALGLGALIAREQGSRLELGHGRSNDSDGLNVSSPTLELSWPLAPRTGASLAWTHDLAEDAGGSGVATRWSAGVRTRWSPAWTTTARGAVTTWDSAGGARLGGEAGLIARPADGLRLELVAAREPILTRLAMRETVSLLTWALAADLSLAPRLALHADARAGSYSDGNRSERTSLSAGWRAHDSRAWELSAFVALDQLNVHRDLDHGYYDPDFHREWGPGLEVTHRPGPRWSMAARARTGWQREKGSTTESMVGLSGRLEWQPDLDWTVAAEGGAGDSNLQSESGYRRSWWRLSAARGF